ncbi:MAG: urocanate hydratase [Acholeplasmatales bacterium]|nr:MAG: urocanate hydratase [Acholeplasmatales bacterium]
MTREFHESRPSVSLLDLFDTLPKHPGFAPGIRRAPKRFASLSEADIVQALDNALRYIPESWQGRLIDEFYEELMTTGRIYGYRFRPEGPLTARPINQYEGMTLEGRAFQVMIDNNLSFAIALYPYELVTYGESGQVFQNWMQYRLVTHYLQKMAADETLVLMSGHPLGLFKSFTHAPRVILTNGLMIGQYDTPAHFARAAALGVANYGQMTAGGWMYIGPQGIVHGTYSTLLNAGRMKLGIHEDKDLAGVLFVSSGLGGMSGAQGKAMKMAGGVGLIAEVDRSRIETRHEQGWVDAVFDTPDAAYQAAKDAQDAGHGASLAYHGNIVELLEYAVTHSVHIDLLSDQTSCHNVYEGGYTPQGLSFAARTALIKDDPDRFKQHVDAGLKRHFKALKTLHERGIYFFDYGNSFMKAVFDAGIAEVCQNGQNPNDGFIWPSYVEDIMGPTLFDYGYGPFRWVCLSGDPEDLAKTDAAAKACIDPKRRVQDRDNYHWVDLAGEHDLVVGTQARILYQDAWGRRDIARTFNAMVREGTIGALMLGRDHHDTGGTDSPFRETANIYDGSRIMSEMATHVFAGNAARGMSLVALHNGGGVGTGKAINGGYGLVLDGSERVDAIIDKAMMFDVMGGVARRAWARNAAAVKTSARFNAQKDGHVTLPETTDKAALAAWIKTKLRGGETG